jgi:hypothetical protein
VAAPASSLLAGCHRSSKVLLTHQSSIEQSQRYRTMNALGSDSEMMAVDTQIDFPHLSI